MQHVLRPYQVVSENEVRAAFAKGYRRVLLVLPTGAGKTTVFSSILKSLAAKGNKGAMVVRGRQLVDQGSKRLQRDGVHHGVVMSNHWKKDARAPVQVCSIDTMIARGDVPEGKLLVIDEAHLFTSPGCKEFIDKFLERNEGSFVLSVTASPWTKEPLKHLGDVVVSPITISELMDQGYLLRPRYYSPSSPEMKGLKTVAGDWVAEQAHQRMSVLTGDIVEHWIKLGQNRPTLGFAANLAHSREMVAAFKARGIPAEDIEGTHTFAEREAAIERLRLGKTKVIWSVGTMGTGVDIPFLGCIISGRPTQSYNLYIQQMGRGTRPCPEVGKKDFIVLDHAGNVIRHGFITKNPDIDLDGRKKKTKVMGEKAKRCEICYLNFTEPFCPECGPTEKEKQEILIEAGELMELTENPVAAEIVQYVKQQDDYRKKHGLKKMWLYYRVRARWGERIAMELFPKEAERAENVKKFTGKKKWY